MPVREWTKDDEALSKWGWIRSQRRTEATTEGNLMQKEPYTNEASCESSVRQLCRL